MNPTSNAATLLGALRILLVEDDPAHTYIQQKLLGSAALAEEPGGLVTHASTLAEALARIAHARFDVILLDLTLPDSRGLGTLDAVRGAAGAAAIVVLSSLQDEEVALAALARGAEDYLFKSELDASRIRRAIRYALERRRAAVEYTTLQRLQVTLDSLAAPIAVLDHEGHVALVNHAWSDFAATGGYADASAGVGMSYFQVSPLAGAAGGAPLGMAEAIREVAAGRLDSWTSEYPAHTPGGSRCYSVRITRCHDPHLAVVVAHEDVTARKEADAQRKSAEDALRQSETRYRSLIENSIDGMMLTSPDGTILAANPAMCRMLGYTEPEIVALGRQGLMDQTDPRLAAALEERRRTGRFHGEMRMIRKDGSRIPVELSTSVYLDERGMERTSVVLRDVSERKRLEAERETLLARVENKRRRLEEMFRLAPAFVATVRGPQHTFEYANEAYVRLVGGRPLIGRTVAEVFPELRGQSLPAILDRVLVSGEPFSASEMPIELRNGPESEPILRFLTFVYQPLREPNGECSGVLAHGIDVTEQVRARQEVERAAAANRHHLSRLEAVLQALPVGVAIADASGRIETSNPAWLETGGGDGALPPGESPLSRALRIGEISLNQEVELHGRDGSPRIFLGSALPIYDEAGKITGGVAVQMDITDARAREAHARLLAAAIENLHEGVALISAEEGQILYANRAYGQILGFDPDEPEKPRLFDFDPAGQAPPYSEVSQVVRDRGGWRGRIRRRRFGDGREVDLDVALGHVNQTGGKESILFAVIRDVTEQIRSERQLHRAERLAGIGTLVGGVAHELNNPLAAIIGLTELILLDAQGPELREDLETIRREAERMAAIVSDVRLLARDTQEENRQREPLQLNQVVRHVVKTRGYSLRTHNIELCEDLSGDLPPIHADRGQIEQVLLNLIVNAEHAVSSAASDRRITLRTRRTDSGVSAEVADNGSGIRPEHLERIFDPFFTTKSPGEGTGLGLSMVSRLITEHGGQVHVESEVGVGTTFRIDLPAIAAVPQEPPARGSAEAGSKRKLRILAVDDEASVRNVLVRYLTRRGHQVQEASDGSRAIDVLDSDPDGFDIILSDLRMPGLGGEQLLARLRERNDGMEHRLVFLTGDTATEQAKQILRESKVPVLTKPLDMASVAGVLERLVPAG